MNEIQNKLLAIANDESKTLLQRCIEMHDLKQSAGPDAFEKATLCDPDFRKYTNEIAARFTRTLIENYDIVHESR